MTPVYNSITPEYNRYVTPVYNSITSEYNRYVTPVYNKFLKYFRKFHKTGDLVSINGVDNKLLYNVANRNHDYLEATTKFGILVLTT